MTSLTHDTTLTGPRRRCGPRLTAGLAFAVVSAVSFGLSGALARGLLDTGWSPGAVVLVRVAVGALVVDAARGASPCAAGGGCCAATPDS